MSPHGIPLDLLDRLLILATVPYSERELSQIIQVRAEEEDVELEEETLELLTEIAASSSLRYAIQLITTSALAAAKRKSSRVETDDVRRVTSLFADVHTSTETLRAQESLYISDERERADAE
jgi:RuvB-like protein 2